MLFKPLIWVHPLLVRVHIGTRIERFRTERTVVQSIVHVDGRYVFLQRN